MGDVRVVEVLAALSLTTDLASGMPFEKGLRVCLVTDRLAAVLGLSHEQHAAAFHTALLRSIGCTSHAPENARLFVDDTAFQAALRRLDPADPAVFAAQLAEFGRWAAAGHELAERFLELAPTEGPVAAAGACELSRALAPAFGVTDAVVRALDDVYERWDGLGIPRGRRGPELAVEARVLHTAEQLAPVNTPDLLMEVVAREPTPRRTVGAGELPPLCSVLGTVADLKSLYQQGHSQMPGPSCSATAPGSGCGSRPTGRAASWSDARRSRRSNRWPGRRPPTRPASSRAGTCRGAGLRTCRRSLLFRGRRRSSRPPRLSPR